MYDRIKTKRSCQKDIQSEDNSASVEEAKGVEKEKEPEESEDCGKKRKKPVQSKSLRKKLKVMDISPFIQG